MNQLIGPCSAVYTRVTRFADVRRHCSAGHCDPAILLLLLHPCRRGGDTALLLDDLLPVCRTPVDDLHWNVTFTTTALLRIVAMPAVPHLLTATMLICRPLPLL